MPDNLTPPLEGTGGSPAPQPQFFTPRDAFESVKPKLIAKYGEDLANTLASDYNRGEMLTISDKENYIDGIHEKAREAKSNVEGYAKRNEVYKTFNMDEKAGEDAIKDYLEKDTDFAEMVKEDPSLLNKPAIVRKVLKAQAEKVQAETNRMAQYGVTAGKTTETRYEELASKRGSREGLTRKETEEYHILLEQKHLKLK